MADRTLKAAKITTVNNNTVDVQLAGSPEPLRDIPIVGGTANLSAGDRVLIYRTGSTFYAMTVSGNAHGGGKMSMSCECTPGGSPFQIQYNEDSQFAGDPNMVWDEDNRAIVLNSGVTVPGYAGYINFGGVAGASGVGIRISAGGVMQYRNTTGVWTDMGTGSGASTPGGVEGSIQYNASSAFAGEAALLWNSVNDLLEINGVTTGGLRNGINFSDEVYLVYDNGAGDNVLYFKTGAGTEIMSLDHDTGKVTIGSVATGYTFPSVDGANGYVLSTNGNGTLSWVAAGGAGSSWLLAGNAGTVPGTHFVGTIDDQALELHVNSTRALRLEPNATSPNIIGGHSENSISTGHYGGTISGGGVSGLPNTISASSGLGTISGGANNTLDGVSGGGTICGGRGNNISDAYSTICGGYYGTISSMYSIILGGHNNQVHASHSAAGGYRAHVVNSGSFVWSDYSVAADFYSAANNEFAIRAEGGFRIARDNHHYMRTIVDADGNATFDLTAVFLRPEFTFANIVNMDHQFRLRDASGNYVGFAAPTGGDGTIWTLPDTDGNSGDALTTDGAGTLGWGGGATTSWSLTGNAGTTLGTNFIGTTDTESFEIRQGNVRALVFYPNYNMAMYDNVLGGGTIYSIVLGGSGIIVNEIENGTYSVIGGGGGNVIRTLCSADVISGGYYNTVNDNATYSTIPGGRSNVIGDSADYAFAAGRRAQANHSGSFVWADHTDADFVSAAEDEFAIRAGGGLRLAYDNLNYVQATVNTGGNLTLDATGGYVIVDSHLQIANENMAVFTGETRWYKYGTVYYVGLQAPATSDYTTYTLPAADGTAGQILSTDGNGVLSWISNIAGSGDVIGPASATDNAIVRFDGTTGKLIQNSVGILTDSGALSGLALLTMSGDIDLNNHDLILDADGDTYLHAFQDDGINLNLATISGMLVISINGADDFIFTANTFQCLAGSHISMGDDTWLGNSQASGGRIYFDHTPTPDEIRVTDASFVIGETLYIAEQPAALASVAGLGQIWVKNTSPNELWFTDDAGNDMQLGVGGGLTGSGANTQVAYWTAANTLTGDAGLTYNAATDTLTIAGGLTLSGATTINVLTIPDNVADAMSIEDGGGLEYLRAVSTNGASELLLFPSGGGLVGIGRSPSYYTLEVEGTLSVHDGAVAGTFAPYTSGGDDWMEIYVDGPNNIGHVAVLAESTTYASMLLRSIFFTDSTAQGTPSSGFGVLYYTGDKLYYKDDSGVEHELGNASSVVEDDAYGPGWNGDTTHAPSQNAVYDKIEAMGGGTQIAYGTYSGNDTAGRQITTGFQCRLVVITDTSADTYMWVVVNESGEYCVEHMADGPSNYDHDRDSYPHLHASNGFVLGDDTHTANDTGNNYRYVAFG